MDMFEQNNRKNTKQHTLDSKCAYANIQKHQWEFKSWVSIQKVHVYWEPQTFRDFSNMRHTMSHKVQFICSVTHWIHSQGLKEDTEGQADLSILGMKKVREWQFHRGLWQWQNTGAVGKYKKREKEKKNPTQTKQNRRRTEFQRQLERMMKNRKVPLRFDCCLEPPVFFSPCLHLVVESVIASVEGPPTKWGR